MQMSDEVWSVGKHRLSGKTAGFATSYGSELAARILVGFAAGSGECLVPLTIADILFLHETGTIMALYTAPLNLGVSVGIIIAGVITINHDWRYIYHVASALIGSLTLLVILTMPETSYVRGGQNNANHQRSSEDFDSRSHPTYPNSITPEKKSYLANLKLYQGKLTKESVWKIFLRPVVMLALPPVLWATLVMSVTIGFLVAISSNFAAAFGETYGFAPWQSAHIAVAV